MEKRVRRSTAPIYLVGVVWLVLAVSSSHSMGMGDALLAAPDLPPLNGVTVLRAGVQLGALKGRVFAPDHALALALANPLTFPHLDLTRQQALSYQRGETLPCGQTGYLLACYQGLSLGFGKASGGQMKNHYPKGLRRP